MMSSLSTPSLWVLEKTSSKQVYFFGKVWSQNTPEAPKTDFQELDRYRHITQPYTYILHLATLTFLLYFKIVGF